METVCFRLPGHGDTTLKHMNSLRSRQHFCDITIVASNNQTFKGHKVVLAACSPFLRDQFLLNPSPRLQVSMLYSSSVVCDLLQSCYTGMLQFSPEEIVNYLTAASYFQMEHIVERCRTALERYVQLKNPSLLKEDGQVRPVILSANVHSVASPLTTQPSPIEQHSPAVITLEEENSETSAQHTGKLTFYLYIPEEELANRGGEADKGDSVDVPQDLCYPETNRIFIAGDGSECDLDSAEDLSFGGLKAFRRRLSEPKISRGRGKGRGRGFKKRKWGSSQEKRSPTLAHRGFALDFSQEDLKTAANYFVDFPRLDFALGSVHGEKVSPMNQFSLEESGAGEGSSGLNAVGTNEGGDESVTSSVTGPVICEHCGLTFPSAHSLAIHSRSTHLLYVCPCCGKHFHHSSNLTRHMAVHRGAAKAHQCPLCYKTFTQKSTLIDHMNLHSGERPHRCAYCHARFAHKPALRRHLKEQHGKTTGQNSLHELKWLNEKSVGGAIFLIKVIN
uniref:Zinc finger and BTB domain containing 12, tandem duplicate 1 n=1 Tax=Poecilia reticulata TaxID=8081 RepID=A0A3P9N129_POERE